VQQAAAFELDGALLKVLLDASGSPLRNGTKCAMFCYYGDITGAAHRVVWQCFSLPPLSASGLQAACQLTTRAPGVINVLGLILGLQHGQRRLVSRVFVCLSVYRITRKLLINFFEGLGNIWKRTIDQRVHCLIPHCFFSICYDYEDVVFCPCLRQQR